MKLNRGAARKLMSELLLELEILAGGTSSTSSASVHYDILNN